MCRQAIRLRDIQNGYAANWPNTSRGRPLDPRVSERRRGASERRHALSMLQYEMRGMLVLTRRLEQEAACPIPSHPSPCSPATARR